MNKLSKSTIAAAAALLFCSTPGITRADTTYFLVGSRHVYRIGVDPYALVDQRQKIEQDYADQVAADQDLFNKALADGSDPQKESDDLNAALDDLAKERDEALGALYANGDEERPRHPELQINCDGPYQVIGVELHTTSGVEVFQAVFVLAPWPAYVPVEQPFGWQYGVHYRPFAFHKTYSDWYVAHGRPAFAGFSGHAGSFAKRMDTRWNRPERLGGIRPSHVHRLRAEHGATATHLEYRHHIPAARPPKKPEHHGRWAPSLPDLVAPACAMASRPHRGVARGLAARSSANIISTDPFFPLRLQLIGLVSDSSAVGLRAEGCCRNEQAT